MDNLQPPVAEDNSKVRRKIETWANIAARGHNLSLDLVPKLESALEKSKHEYQKLEGAVKKLFRENRELENEQAELEEMNLDLRDENDNLRQDKYELLDQVDELRARLSNCWTVPTDSACFKTKKWKTRIQIEEVGHKHYCIAPGPDHEVQEVKDIDRYRCPICWELYQGGDETLLLPCRHRFHAECVSGCLNNAKLSCPRCTKKFELGAQLT